MESLYEKLKPFILGGIFCFGIFTYLYINISRYGWSGVIQEIPRTKMTPVATRIWEADKMEMVLVPAGEFQMGCDVNSQFPCDLDALPVHKVFLDGYWIDRTEVTNGQYKLCVLAGACKEPEDNSSVTRISYYRNINYKDYPIARASWFNAVDYCTWAGKRLPTEAEWEKAARGANDTRAYPWGNDQPTCDLANINQGYDTCIGDTRKVGSYPDGASPYGALDMFGNEAEWVQDWFSDSYYIFSPKENPQGPWIGDSRVYRGGDSTPKRHNDAISSRDREKPNTPVLGFRCVISETE